jgi:DNA-binding MarR family transcriptional regulator
MDAPPHAPPRVQHWIELHCALSRQQRQWQAALDEALRPQELAGVDFLTLWIIDQAPPPGLSQVDIARHLAVSTTQVCGLVDSLQQRGWLHTVRRTDDRRRHACCLSESGVLLLQQLLPLLDAAAQRCLADHTLAPSTACAERRAA